MMLKSESYTNTLYVSEYGFKWAVMVKVLSIISITEIAVESLVILIPMVWLQCVYYNWFYGSMKT